MGGKSLLDEKTSRFDQVVVESLMWSGIKTHAWEKQSMGGKSLLDEKPPGLAKFVVESIEVVQDETSAWEKQSVGVWEENCCWMKTSGFY